MLPAGLAKILRVERARSLRQLFDFVSIQSFHMNGIGMTGSMSTPPQLDKGASATSAAGIGLEHAIHLVPANADMDVLSSAMHIHASSGAHSVIQAGLSHSQPSDPSSDPSGELSLTDDTATFIFAFAFLLAMFVVLRYLLYKLEVKMGMHNNSPLRAAMDPLPTLDVGPKFSATRPLARRTEVESDAADLRAELLALRSVDDTESRTGSFEAARLRKASRPVKARPASLASTTWMPRPSNLSIHSAIAASRPGSRPHSPRSTVRTGHLSPLSPRTKSGCKSPLLGSARLQTPILQAIEEGFRTMKSHQSPKKFNALMSAVLANETSGISTAVRSPKTPKRMARTYDEGFDAGLEGGFEERKPLMSPRRQL